MFYDDAYEDPNLTLPNHFITCFDPDDLPRYQKAITLFSALKPDHGLEIDESGQWNAHRLPALLCYARGNLTLFWRILEGLPREMS